MGLVSNNALVRDMDAQELAMVCHELYCECRGQLSKLPEDKRDLFIRAWGEHVALTGGVTTLPKLGKTLFAALHG